MAPLARTLALLAMAVATVAIKVVPLDMAKNSFDDQYLKCSVETSKNLPKLQDSDFLKNEKFKENWTKAMDLWQKLGSVSSPLSPDQAIALMAYTVRDIKLCEVFNAAVLEAGSSRRKYQNKFHFKSLHFLLTQALQKLRHPNECQDVFRGVHNYQYQVKKDDQVRFGQFVLTSLTKMVAQAYGKDTMFKVRTCHGADIHKFSMYPSQREVLIPPFETFEVIDVRKEGNTMHIELRSTGTSSNYDCEWLKGESLRGNFLECLPQSSLPGEAPRGGNLPRNSPHFGGLLLATMAMAVSTGTL